MSSDISHSVTRYHLNPLCLSLSEMWSGKTEQTLCVCVCVCDNRFAITQLYIRNLLQHKRLIRHLDLCQSFKIPLHPALSLILILIIITDSLLVSLSISPPPSSLYMFCLFTDPLCLLSFTEQEADGLLVLKLIILV